jgi:hypothetical protein
LRIAFLDLWSVMNPLGEVTLCEVQSTSLLLLLFFYYSRSLEGGDAVSGMTAKVLRWKGKMGVEVWRGRAKAQGNV